MAALLGVMDGAASDLRTGLALADGGDPRAGPVAVHHRDDARGDARGSWTATRGSAGCAATAGSSSPCWIPRRGELSVFQDGEFQPYQPQATVLPKAASSVDWYRGWRDHLEFAEIEPD